MISVWGTAHDLERPGLLCQTIYPSIHHSILRYLLRFLPTTIRSRFHADARPNTLQILVYERFGTLRISSNQIRDIFARASAMLVLRQVEGRRCSRPDGGVVFPAALLDCLHAARSGIGRGDSSRCLLVGLKRTQSCLCLSQVLLSSDPCPSAPSANGRSPLAWKGVVCAIRLSARLPDERDRRPTLSFSWR